MRVQLPPVSTMSNTTQPEVLPEKFMPFAIIRDKRFGDMHSLIRELINELPADVVNTHCIVFKLVAIPREEAEVQNLL